MTNYIYLIYGDSEDSYTEAAYSIGTLKRRLAADSQIVVFTDRPEKIKDWPVVCESVAGELAAMRGKKDFSHRAKLGAILKCFERHPGNVIYLDSDTFIRGDIEGLAARLAPGTAIMHRFECVNPELGLAEFQTTLAGGIHYRFSAESQMFNAGVIGLHCDDVRLIRIALELCDAILEFGGTRIHTSEQFAVSEAMRICGIKMLEARRVIEHYINHRFYIRAKVRERTAKTGRQPWAFERPIPYAYLMVYWLRKFGRYRQ
jgi:hypothetical protein